jgi:hypothetical protein
MNAGRSGHGMAVYKGRVYVYGGWGADWERLASVEVLLNSDGWHRLKRDLVWTVIHFASVALPAANYDRCQNYCECKKNSSLLCVDGVDCHCSIVVNLTGNQQTTDEIRQQQRIEEHQSSNPYHGILINSYFGTQLFDFDYFPYSTGYYSLGLQKKCKCNNKRAKSGADW